MRFVRQVYVVVYSYLYNYINNIIIVIKNHYIHIPNHIDGCPNLLVTILSSLLKLCIDLHLHGLAQSQCCNVSNRLLNAVQVAIYTTIYSLNNII